MFHLWNARGHLEKQNNQGENTAPLTSCCKKMNPNGWNAVAFKARKVHSLHHVAQEKKKNVTTQLLQLSLLNPHMCTVPEYSNLNEKKAPERTVRAQKCLGSRNLTSLSFFFCLPISLVFILTGHLQSAYSLCGKFSWPSANTLHKQTGQTPTFNDMFLSRSVPNGKRSTLE